MDVPRRARGSSRRRLARPWWPTVLRTSGQCQSEERERGGEDADDDHDRRVCQRVAALSPTLSDGCRWHERSPRCSEAREIRVWSEPDLEGGGEHVALAPGLVDNLKLVEGRRPVLLARVGALMSSRGLDRAVGGRARAADRAVDHLLQHGSPPEGPRGLAGQGGPPRPPRPPPDPERIRARPRAASARGPRKGHPIGPAP